MDHEKGLKLSEIADGVSVEDVKAATGCSFQVRLRGYDVNTYVVKKEPCSFSFSKGR